MKNNTGFYFTSYQEWHQAITIRCNIKLTPDYAEQRINALSNTSDPNTIEFVTKYGADYTNQVIQWFERAKQA